MSKELRFLIEKSKENNAALLEVLDLFEPKINHCLYQTQFNQRDDLKQDLIIKLMTTINNYDVDSVPGFWEMHDNYKNTKSSKIT